MTKQKITERLSEQAVGISLVIAVLMFLAFILFYLPSSSNSPAGKASGEIAVQVNNISESAVKEMYDNVEKNQQKKLDAEKELVAEQEAKEKAKIDAEKKVEAEKQKKQQDKLKEEENKRIAKIEKDKAAAEKITLAKESEKIAKQQESEKIAKEKAEKVELAKEKAAKEKAEKDELAKEKAAKEKAEKAELAKEKAAKDAKLAAEKSAKEKADKIAKERLLTSIGQGITDRKNENAKNDAIARHSELIREAAKNNWIIPPKLPDGLQVKLHISTSIKGDVLKVTIVNSSGNGAFDNSAIEAVKRASPLPLPSNAEWALEFKEFDFNFSPR